MSAPLIVPLVGLAVVLAGILVGLGRVLQRQDANDTADGKRDELIATLRQAKHDHAGTLQGLTSRVEHLAASDQRADAAARELIALVTDVSHRLIRIESRMEGSSPNHLRARTPAPR